ncbi:MAG TPA: hypothetical protein VFJ90_11870 [Candidatus Didemnitutus sp.]|nr:hypothetical protein [Candidatus Didemnitutus sp.]
MKHGLVVLMALMVAVGLRADGDFTKTMTPDELTTTGLAKLTPEELAALKVVIERYRSGEVAVVEKEAEPQVAAAKPEKADTKVADADARAKERSAATKTETPPAVAEQKKQPSWMSALITLKRTEDKPDKTEAYETRIAGEFTGWRSHTTFRLENGQVWQQVDGDPYVGVHFDSPKVTIKPGAFGTFWMKIEGVNPKVKVKPIKLE